MPAEAPKTVPFRITAPHPDGGGPDTAMIEVAGQDVTAGTYGVEFAAQRGEIPRLVLWRHELAGTIEAEGVVAVVDPNLTAADAPEVLAAVADRVRGLDAQAVRDAAMRIQGLRNCPLPDAWLEAIADQLEAEG